MRSIQRRHGRLRSRRSKPGSPTAATGRWPSSSRPTSRPRILTELLAAARASLPERVRAWLNSLRASWRSGDLLFVHAGVNPHFDLEEFLAVPWNMPLASLDEERHWAWVRWPFLNHRPGPEGFSGVFVVHGHTPNDARRDASHQDQIAGFRLNLSSVTLPQIPHRASNCPVGATRSLNVARLLAGLISNCGDQCVPDFDPAPGRSTASHDRPVPCFLSPLSPRRLDPRPPVPTCDPFLADLVARLRQIIEMIGVSASARSEWQSPICSYASPVF